MADVSDPATPDPEPKQPPAARRRSGVLPLMAGGVLAAALGFAAAQFAPVAPETANLRGDVDALKAELTRLSETSAAASALAARLDALEAADPPDVSALSDRIQALEQALNQLKSAPAPAADPAALAALQAQIDALEQGGLPTAALEDINAAFEAKLSQADARLAQVTADAEAIATASARRAGLLALQAALDSGAPYPAALASLSGLTIPPVLADHSAAGLPSLPSLRASFPDAARAALDAALQANMGESWADRVSNFLLNQTGARSLTPREGSDPDAILSRAEAALGAGDLALVLAEAAALPPEAQAAMDTWLAQARLRQEATQAVQALTQAAGL